MGYFNIPFFIIDTSKKKKKITNDAKDMKYNKHDLMKTFGTLHSTAEEKKDNILGHNADLKF